MQIKYHNFERIEIRATVFLKWTDFSVHILCVYCLHVAVNMYYMEQGGVSLVRQVLLPFLSTIEAKLFTKLYYFLKLYIIQKW